MKTTSSSLAVLLVAAACSSSGGYKGGGGVQACGNSSIRVVEPCATCLQAQCADLVSSCYGAGWRQAVFSGTCSDLFACSCKCASGDQSCVAHCQANASSECAQCQADVSGCAAANCSAQCQGSGTGGTSGVGGTSGTGGL